MSNNLCWCFSDLVAELVKFNPPLLEQLSHSIAEACEGNGAARFGEMVAGNIVNSSVCMYSLERIDTCTRTEQNRTEQNRTEQNRTEQNRTRRNAIYPCSVV
jgi:hypothetical protein